MRVMHEVKDALDGQIMLLGPKISNKCIQRVHFLNVLLRVAGND